MGNQNIVVSPQQSNWKIGLYIFGLMIFAGGGFAGGYFYCKNKNIAIQTGNVAGIETNAPNQMPNASSSAQPNQSGIMGTVTSVSSSSITIKNNRTSKTTTYSIDSSTKISSDGEEVATSDIEVGDNVMIETTDSDSTAASTISIVAAQNNNGNAPQGGGPNGGGTPPTGNPKSR